MSGRGKEEKASLFIFDIHFPLSHSFRTSNIHIYIYSSRCLKDEGSYFTLNRVKEYVRETGLRVAEYSYCQPRNKAVPPGDFAIFLELESVTGLTSHHGVKVSSKHDTDDIDHEDDEEDDDNIGSGGGGGALSLSSRISAAAAAAVESSSSSSSSSSQTQYGASKGGGGGGGVNPFTDPYTIDDDDDGLEEYI
jgi:hypothetical protein